MLCRGVRGATTADDNTRDAILAATRQLLALMIRINGIELYLTKGVGIATGTDPLETDPDISISISRDGGQTWSNPRVVKIG
jgi:Neuraminidase (sialidase)